MHLLEKKLRDASAEGRTALIPFVTAGYPSPDAFWNVIEELDESGADVIEIGVPVFRSRGRRSRGGGGVPWEALKKRRHAAPYHGRAARAQGQVQGRAGAHGLHESVFCSTVSSKLATEAQDVDVEFTVSSCPIFPTTRRATCARRFRRTDWLSFLWWGPNTSEERMKLYADVSEGYVYVVSVMGTTGEARRACRRKCRRCSPRVRRVFSLPVALGFGLRVPEQLDALPKDIRPDAAVFGRFAPQAHCGGQGPCGLHQNVGSPPGRAFPAFRNAPAFAARGGRSEKRSVLRPALRDVLPFRRTGGLPGVFLRHGQDFRADACRTTKR